MISDDDILVLEEPELGAAERLFLPQVLGGMKTTLGHLGKSLVKRPMTVQYPEE